MRAARENHIPRSQTIMMGDGANDLSMIETAGIDCLYGQANRRWASPLLSCIEKRDLSLPLKF